MSAGYSGTGRTTRSSWSRGSTRCCRPAGTLVFFHFCRRQCLPFIGCLFSVDLCRDRLFVYALFFRLLALPFVCVSVLCLFSFAFFFLLSCAIKCVYSVCALFIRGHARILPSCVVYVCRLSRWILFLIHMNNMWMEMFSRVCPSVSVAWQKL